MFLFDMIGTVTDIISPYKAVLTFQYNGKDEQALLVAGRIALKKKIIPNGVPIIQYLMEGTVLEFSCHRFQDNAMKYFVKLAYIQLRGLPSSIEMTPNNYLHNMVGKVIEIHLPYKAILSFQLNGKAERALLRADKIIVNGQNVPMGESIVNYVQIGSMLKFVCHGFDETGQDRCGYFVTVAWRQEPDGVNSTGAKNSTEIFLGIYNASGVIVEVSQRQGVIQYSDADGRDHNVLFFGSKLYLFGKRTSSKQNINLTLAMDDKVQFDAVPCEQTENDSHCPWFATLVWKGKKPAIEYDNPVLPIFEPKNLSSELKQLTSNPKSLFVRAKGQILQILNEEFGVALAAVKLNNWESVLFHRSACFLFKLNLASHDLTKIFQEGDKVSFIAARASRQYITQWVASQVTLDISKDLDYEYEVQLDPSHTL